MKDSTLRAAEHIYAKLLYLRSMIEDGTMAANTDYTPRLIADIVVGGYWSAEIPQVLDRAKRAFVAYAAARGYRVKFDSYSVQNKQGWFDPAVDVYVCKSEDGDSVLRHFLFINTEQKE